MRVPILSLSSSGIVPLFSIVKYEIHLRESIILPGWIAPVGQSLIHA